MDKEQLDRILDAASKEVKSWPEWMQRPENRQRQPHGNRSVGAKQGPVGTSGGVMEKLQGSILWALITIRGLAVSSDSPESAQIAAECDAALAALEELMDSGAQHYKPRDWEI